MWARQPSVLRPEPAGPPASRHPRRARRIMAEATGRLRRRLQLQLRTGSMEARWKAEDG